MEVSAQRPRNLRRQELTQALWAAIDADSKMIVSYRLGDRSQQTATEFMWDLADRLDDRVQLSTDG